MVAVVSNAKGPLNDFGNPGRGPQFGLVPIGHGPAQKDSDYASLLALGQFGRTARSGFGAQPLVPTRFPHIPPSHDGTRVATDLVSDSVQGHPGIEQFHGFTTTLF
jgi:hypothetical protein